MTDGGSGGEAPRTYDEWPAVSGAALSALNQMKNVLVVSVKLMKKDYIFRKENNDGKVGNGSCDCRRRSDGYSRNYHLIWINIYI